MRTWICYSMLSAALAAGACKKTQQEDNRQAAPEVRKSVEDTGDKMTEQDVKQMRDKFVTEARDKLAAIDQELKELGQKTDAKAHELAEELKQRKAELSGQIDAVRERTSEDWHSFTREFDKKLDALDKDVRDALK